MMKGFQKETGVPKKMGKRMAKIDKAAKKHGF